MGRLQLHMAATLSLRLSWLVAGARFSVAIAGGGLAGNLQTPSHAMYIPEPANLFSRISPIMATNSPDNTRIFRFSAAASGVDAPV